MPVGMYFFLNALVLSELRAPCCDTDRSIIIYYLLEKKVAVWKNNVPWICIILSCFK